MASNEDYCVEIEASGAVTGLKLLLMQNPNNRVNNLYFTDW